MKGISLEWSRGRNLSPSLPGDRYLKLGSKSDLQAQISGSIVRYDALAPRPAVLLLSYFVGACAATQEQKFFPYPWDVKMRLMDHFSIVLTWSACSFKQKKLCLQAQLYNLTT